jgi:hypothetical protein
MKEQMSLFPSSQLFAIRHHFVIRHSEFVIFAFVKSRVSTQHPELTKIARHAAL